MAAAGTPISADVVEFMDKAVELGMSGVSYWSWDYCRIKLPEIWNTIAEYEWPGTSNPTLDIVETLLNAFNSRDIDRIASLYTSDAIHINANRTIQGYDAIKTWLNQFLNIDYKDAVFEILDFSGEEQTRYFDWQMTLVDGTEKTGSDTIGLANNKIIYHYSSL